MSYGPSFSEMQNSLLMKKNLINSSFINLIHRKIETLSPWEDNTCRVIIWNLRLSQHSPYTSEQSLINLPYPRLERQIIHNFSFRRNVHDNLIQIFIDLIGLTVESISDFIISQKYCGVLFWSKCWAKWAAKVSKIYQTVPFEPRLGSVVLLFLKIVFSVSHIKRGFFSSFLIY